jgi:hypothetical protein
MGWVHPVCRRSWFTGGREPFGPELKAEGLMWCPAFAESYGTAGSALCVNPANVTGKPLYKIARRFYSKSCGFTLLNKVPFGKFNRVNIYPPLEVTRMPGGSPGASKCGEGELEAPLYPISGSGITGFSSSTWSLHAKPPVYSPPLKTISRVYLFLSSILGSLITSAK